MTIPKDPLQNQTLVTNVNERIESLVPEAYRLKSKFDPRQKNTSYILQGAFKSWNEQGMLFHEWRDLPAVIGD